MSRQKLSILIIGTLLLCNITLMWQVWHTDILSREHSRGEGPRCEIIERLKFDKQQVQQYDVLIQEHRTQMRQKEEEISSLKTLLYQTLTDSSLSKDSLILLIARQQTEVEYINLKHFKNIGTICHPDQKKDYNELVMHLAQLFIPPKPMHH